MGLTEKEQLIIDVEYYKHKYDNVEFLAPNEAECLLDCYANESMRRYGKINKEAPLYRKLSRIITNSFPIKDKEGNNRR